MNLKKISSLLVIFMVLGTIGCIIVDYDASRILTYVAVIPVILVPLLLRKTKYKLNDRELLFYYLFIFLADFLGCVVNLYNKIGWYDLFTHFLSGIFTFGVGMFILKRVGIQWKNFSFDLLFCFCFVMFVAGIWELFEYVIDGLLGMDLQHHLDTGVNDTMEDMLAAFIGGIVTLISYFGVKRKMFKSEYRS